jgi:hypothetical protein
VAKRWINSADVLVDDQGRVAVLLPAELVQDNRLKVDAQVEVEAELDAEAITGPPPYARTLADLDGRLEWGLFNYGTPWFQELRWALDYYFYNGWYGYEPWLATVNRSINDGFYYHLYNQGNYEPWLQTIDRSINDNFYYMLYCGWGGRPWLEQLDYDINDSLYYYLYSPWAGQPWLEALYFNLEWLLYSYWGGTVAEMLDGMRYDLMDARWALEDMRAILQDVYDSSSHALRTVAA